MTECQNCEYHKNRAARWRAEAYKQAGHDVIELPWVGLTKQDVYDLYNKMLAQEGNNIATRYQDFAKYLEAKLKEKNT